MKGRNALGQSKYRRCCNETEELSGGVGPCRLYSTLEIGKTKNERRGCTTGTRWRRTDVRWSQRCMLIRSCSGPGDSAGGRQGRRRLPTPGLCRRGAALPHPRSRSHRRRKTFAAPTAVRCGPRCAETPAGGGDHPQWARLSERRRIRSLFHALALQADLFGGRYANSFAWAWWSATGSQTRRRRRRRCEAWRA